MYVQCETCPRYFVNYGARNQHMHALDHWAERYECETCDDEFLDKEECFDHMDSFGHWAPKYECEACNSKFHTVQQANNHMNAKNHWRLNWCEPCQRGFQNANNLRQHLHGAAHMANSIRCPFCNKSHTTASGIVHHLETNSCPNAPRLNRETIYKLIHERDTAGNITNKQLTWHSHENGNYIATSAAWNGHTFECYLCHKTYGTLASLNQHLSSPAHKQNIYHCFGRGCSKQFKALAALFNHLESESCGATRFNTVQKNANAILTGRRLIAF